MTFGKMTLDGLRSLFQPMMLWLQVGPRVRKKKPSICTSYWK